MPSGIAENKYRAAIEVLMSGRDILVGSLADDILDQAEDLADGGFLFNEFLETQGTRLHFLGLMIAQLEQSADSQYHGRRHPSHPRDGPRPLLLQVQSSLEQAESGLVVELRRPCPSYHLVS